MWWSDLYTGQKGIVIFLKNIKLILTFWWRYLVHLYNRCANCLNQWNEWINEWIYEYNNQFVVFLLVISFLVVAENFSVLPCRFYLLTSRYFEMLFFSLLTNLFLLSPLLPVIYSHWSLDRIIKFWRK